MFYLQEFLNYLKKEVGFTENSVNSYEQDLLQFIDYLNKEEKPIEVKSFSKENLQQFFVFSVKEKRISTRTMARYQVVFRKFADYLILKKLITENPTAEFVTPKFEKKLPSFFNEEDLVSLFDDNIEYDNYMDFRDRVIVELFYSCGIRLSELADLTINSFDFIKATVTVIGKGRKQRIVPVSKKTIEILKRYFNFTQNRGVATNFDTAIFFNKFNKKLSKRGIQLSVDRFFDKTSSLAEVHPHMLRHSFATHLVNNGADIRTVSEMLGHTSLSTTQMYTHLNFKKLIGIYKQSHPLGDK